MKFIFLGTGTSQGVPVVGCKCAVCRSNEDRDKRLRTSLAVQSAQTTLLIDAGPDLRQQLLRSEIEDVDAILITHEHQDHTAGLDEVRAVNFIQQHSIPIYCSSRVAKRLREQYSYIFQNSDYPGIPQIELIEMPQNDFQIGDIQIKPMELVHKDIPVHAFRFGDFSYITDANEIPASEWPKLQGSRYLVINALRQQEHHSHFNLQEAQEIADSLQVEKAWFTHISHQMGLHADVDPILPTGRALAYDGLVIET